MTRYAVRSTDTGLTLIEVLVAVTILAVGMVGVLRAYAGAVATLEAGQYNITAVQLLQRKLADIREEILEKGAEMPRRGAGRFEGEYGDFSWAWTIAPAGIEALNELELTVSSALNSRTFTVKTYVTDPPEEKDEDEI